MPDRDSSNMERMGQSDNGRVSETQRLANTNKEIASIKKRLAIDYKLQLKNSKELSLYAEELRKKADKESNKEKKAQLEEEALLAETYSKMSLKKREQATIDLENQRADLEKQHTREVADLSNTLKSNLVNLAVNAVSDSIGSLITTSNSYMDSYVEGIEKIAYNLNGTGVSAKEMTNSLLDATSGTGLVKLEKLYLNLSNLVESGIVYDAEARAYLMTLSNDLGMGYDLNSKSLNRLINLWRDDFTDNRMAIEASLKTFLNQNYQTSLYIKEGFASVSEALLDALALSSSASAASKFEATVQKWMGSLSSLGMSDSTIDSLAQAINAVGSGNISQLSGTAMQRLLIMSMNESGTLDYGSILLNGITQSDTELLMQGMIDYITNTIATSDNNVVMSKLAEVFGLSVSDVMAAKNASNYNIAQLIISDNIVDAVLNKMDDYLYLTTKINNTLSNLQYGAAIEIASDEIAYMSLKVLSLVSDVAGTILEGQTITISPLGVGVDLDIGKIVKLAPAVTFLAGIASNISLTNANGIGSLLSGQSVAQYTYNSLLSRSDLSVISTGNISGLDKGLSLSGSMILETDTNSLANAATTSSKLKTQEVTNNQQTDNHDLDDIYDVLDGVRSNVSSVVSNGRVNVSLDQQSMQTSTDYSGSLSNILGALQQIATNTGSEYTNKTNTSNKVSSITVNNTVSLQVASGYTDEDLLAVQALNLQNIYQLLLNWYEVAINGENNKSLSVEFRSNSLNTNYYTSNSNGTTGSSGGRPSRW